MSEPTSPGDADKFDRCNLSQLKMNLGPQHGGVGDMLFTTIAGSENLAGPCNFIDYAEVPPNCSIGQHQHPEDEEEFYLILGGEGDMQRDGKVFRVREGDLIRNEPGGTHGLVNVGEENIKLFVINLRLTR